MAEHTPTPWELIDERQIYAGEKLLAEVTDTAEGLEGSCAEADANAAFIVRAVNCHAELLSACAAALQDLLLHSRNDPGRCGVCATCEITIPKLKRALAIAQGMTP
jgi:hypothetical protein